MTELGCTASMCVALVCEHLDVTCSLNCRELVALEIGSVQTLVPFLISVVGRIWQHLALGGSPVSDDNTVEWMVDISALALTCCDQGLKHTISQLVFWMKFTLTFASIVCSPPYML